MAVLCLGDYFPQEGGRRAGAMCSKTPQLPYGSLALRVICQPWGSSFQAIAGLAPLSSPSMGAGESLPGPVGSRDRQGLPTCVT